jgi:hypothetical protein
MRLSCKRILILLVLFWSLSLTGFAQNAPIVSNGGFEDGPEFEAPPWELDGFNKTTGQRRPAIVLEGSSFARSGKRSVVLGDENVIDECSQLISVPNDGKRYLLTAFMQIGSVEILDRVEDILAFRIVSEDEKTNLVTIDVFANTDEEEFKDFRPVRFDLTPFAGQKVRVSFSSSSDFTLFTLFTIDDVSVIPVTNEPLVTGAKVKVSKGKARITLSTINTKLLQKVFVNSIDVTNKVKKSTGNQIVLNISDVFINDSPTFNENRVRIIDNNQVSNTFVFKVQ